MYITNNLLTNPISIFSLHAALLLSCTHGWLVCCTCYEHYLWLTLVFGLVVVGLLSWQTIHILEYFHILCMMSLCICNVIVSISSAMMAFFICTAIAVLACLGALARAEVFSNSTHRRETRVTGKDGNTMVSSETESVSSR